MNEYGQTTRPVPTPELVHFLESHDALQFALACLDWRDILDAIRDEYPQDEYAISYNQITLAVAMVHHDPEFKARLSERPIR